MICDWEGCWGDAYPPSQLGRDVLRARCVPQIPLSGYGGVSHITLDDLQTSQKNHYWLDIGQVTVNQHVHAKVTIRNIGARAAYISGVCFQGVFDVCLPM